MLEYSLLHTLRINNLNYHVSYYFKGQHKDGTSGLYDSRIVQDSTEQEHHLTARTLVIIPVLVLLLHSGKFDGSGLPTTIVP